MKLTSFIDATKDALDLSMKIDKSVYIFGLGVEIPQIFMAAPKDLKKNMDRIEFSILHRRSLH